VERAGQHQPAHTPDRPGGVLARVGHGGVVT
jgi:hypothetical protein